MRKFILLLLLVLLPCFSQSPTGHILYLLQTGQYDKGISLYQDWVKENDRHDYQMLEQVGQIILNKGAVASDEQTQLLSMYGASISASKEMRELFSHGMQSKNPSTQLATINFLRHNHNDWAVDLLLKAFSSPYPVIRLEAAMALCQKKAHRTTGIIYNLMERFPPVYHGMFANLFAMMGCQESLSILKKLINHKVTHVRIAAILAVANFGRDDFMDQIKKGVNHAAAVEKEACVYALGHFQDFSSLKLFSSLAKDPDSSLALCSAEALMNLGDEKGSARIISEARKKNPFAILMLKNIEQSDHLLETLVKDPDPTIRLNACLALLEKRNPACVNGVMDILTEKTSDLGFTAVRSQTGALVSWKPIASCTQVSKKLKQNLPMVTQYFKEQTLASALELPKNHFLAIAQHVLNEDNNTLIPATIHLLEQMGGEEVTTVLEKQANKVGCPFNRTYAHLSLYRQNVHSDYHKKQLIQWIKMQRSHEMIEFKPMPTLEDTHLLEHEYQLSPKETSLLLIETLDALATRHDKEGIDLIINLIKHGHEKNRYLLAGLLMKCIL